MSSINEKRIRRPSAGDFTERPAVAALRKGGETVAEATGEAARTSVKLTRALLVLFVLPIVALPAVMSTQASFTRGWLQLLWVYAAVVGLAAVAWVWGFRGEWRRRQSGRASRLNDLEDTSELRRRALGSSRQAPTLD